MPNALLLLPDLLLIACGYVICRYTPLNRPVWDGVERLVYHLLFPVLLFSSILRNPVELAAVWRFGASVVGLTLAGIALAFALRWGRFDAHLHASGAQTAFRFNSYVLLALAERLAGSQGVAWAALLVSLCVPLANIAAVWPLARRGGQGFFGELVRNPLIVSTLAGLACNLLGVQLPELANTTLARIGAAALPLGLMAVGAGLRLGALREGPGLAAALLGIRHVALPALAIGIALAWQLPTAQQALLVAYGAMPTASSAYVLAVRMGGHGPYVAALVTASTLIGMVALPLSLMLLKALI